MSCCSKKVAASVLGGMIGAGIVVVALGGVCYHHWRRMKSFYPNLLRFTTDQKSQIPVYSYFVAHHGTKRARLVIPSFAVLTDKPTKSITSDSIIPINFMPSTDSEVKNVHLYSKDMEHTVVGKAQINKNGVISITADQASGVGEAWGLAKELVIEYLIA